MSRGSWVGAEMLCACCSPQAQAVPLLPPPLPRLPTLLQIRAWVCVLLIVMLRLLNLAVPILYKKVRVAVQVVVPLADLLLASLAARLRDGTATWLRAPPPPPPVCRPPPVLHCAAHMYCLPEPQVVDEFSYASARTHPTQGAPTTFKFGEVRRRHQPAMPRTHSGCRRASLPWPLGMR